MPETELIFKHPDHIRPGEDALPYHPRGEWEAGRIYDIDDMVYVNYEADEHGIKELAGNFICLTRHRSFRNPAEDNIFWTRG